jgi:hypothetical protein
MSMQNNKYVNCVEWETRRQRVGQNPFNSHDHNHNPIADVRAHVVPACTIHAHISLNDTTKVVRSFTPISQEECLLHDFHPFGR